MTIDRQSDIARAYRAARRYHRANPLGWGNLRPARLAVQQARAALGEVAEARAAYEAANPLTGDAAAPGALPIDTGEGHAARSAYVDARARAGLYHSGTGWGRGYPDTNAAFRDTVPAHEVTGGPDHTGWYTNPHFDSLCYGVVCQLPGKGGRARYVAGYQFDDCEGGPVLDLTTIYESPAESSWDTPDAMSEAARAADGMAETAAEKEREYQTAWAAGAAWAEAGETIAEARKAALALLSERRAAKAAGTWGEVPAICRAIADSVTGWRRDIAEAREERRELADGCREGLYWSWGRYDESPLEGFAEGAGLTMSEARAIA